MKASKLIFFLVLLFFCHCSNDNEIIAPEVEIPEEEWEPIEYELTLIPGCCFPEVSDKYVYPIVPGMDEWNAANNNVIKFCQLPDDILKSISTAGLIDALISSPLFGVSYMFSSSISVYVWSMDYFLHNSANELYKRKDAGDALINYYKHVCYDCIDEDKIETVYEGDIRSRIMGLEILFTRELILKTIRPEKIKEAVFAILSNYEQYPYLHSYLVRYSVFPLACLMLHYGYEPFATYCSYNAEFLEIIEHGLRSLSHEQVDLIVYFAKSFINS